MFNKDMSEGVESVIVELRKSSKTVFETSVGVETKESRMSGLGLSTCIEQQRLKF